MPKALKERSARENVREGMKAWEISSRVEMKKTHAITRKLALVGEQESRCEKPATAQRLIRPMTKK